MNKYIRTNNIFAVLGVLIVLSLFPLAVRSQQTQPLGPYGNLPWSLTLPVAADTAAIPAQNMTSMLVGTPTAGATYTTDTATNLCALFPFVGAQQSNAFSWDWYIKNTSAGANTITPAGGSGVTLVGTGTAAQSAVRHFKITISGCGAGGTPAAKLYSLETAAF